jgi:N-acetylglucosamine kinase-like BadF-type ATPase
VSLLGLGIDGGGTATRWAVADPAGDIVGAGELPPVSGLLYHADARATFAEMARSLAAAIPPGVGAVIAGITGLTGGSDSAAHARDILASALAVPAASVRVEDDIWIAYHAAFAPGAGHLVYSGTGSIGLHVAADGSLLRVGGRGMLIDDGGSAFWIGRTAIDRMYRDIDATGEARGALAEALFAAIGGRDWDSVRGYVYGGGRTKVALLAMAVADAAREGDAAALALLHEAGVELARLARALVGRIGPLPVALAGRAAGLHPVIETAMRVAAPGIAITRGEADAAAAAARMAARQSSQSS